MKYPYIKFYFRDWQSNSELQSCSIAAKGVWIELMCIMAQCERYGYLERDGKPIDVGTISRLIRVDKPTLNPLLSELESAGVFSRCHLTGAIYSRRMVRDFETAQKFCEFGRKGGNPYLKNLSKNKPISIPIPIPIEGLTLGVKGGVKGKFGEFGHVTLTAEEREKLQVSYGSKLDQAIDVLDSYMESKGKKYKSCYATMKKGGWVWEKVFTNQQQSSSGNSSFANQKPASFFKSKERIDYGF